jgi:hypothetical protein
MVEKSPIEVPAIVINQWLNEWNQVKYSSKEMRDKPDPYFFIFSLPARWLRILSDIYRRQAIGMRSKDRAIQRQLIPERSQEIRRFIHGGFPWSDLSEKQKRLEEYKDLKMPGWLSTAIIANILAPGTERLQSTIRNTDTIQIERSKNQAKIILPANFQNTNWNPPVRPLEIIDGQHRLLAFGEDDDINGNYELPVVAFYDLDITWQAYLFYTINIKPKRINPSLAFDLYPILRIQDWLEKSPTRAAIYRETRAQELTEVLWSHPQSPWYKRINMLGESQGGTITQAAFIRSLMATYIKRWEGGRIGGLFGAELPANSNDVLQWERPQQAAFLILVWQCIADAVKRCKEVWAEELRKYHDVGQTDSRRTQADDPAYTSKFSLLATDQGVRGVLHVTNDLCYVAAEQLKLINWQWHEEMEEDTINDDTVTKALRALHKLPVSNFVEKIAVELTQFDWRVSSAPGLLPDKSRQQMIFRGAGGYKQLRIQLLEILQSSRDSLVSNSAIEVINKLGY